MVNSVEVDQIARELSNDLWHGDEDGNKSRRCGLRPNFREALSRILDAHGIPEKERKELAKEVGKILARRPRRRFLRFHFPLREEGDQGAERGEGPEGVF